MTILFKHTIILKHLKLTVVYHLLKVIEKGKKRERERGEPTVIDLL